MMNNIKEKRFPRNLIFSLYFLQSLWDLNRPTYLILTEKLTITLIEHLGDLWCFNIYLKHTCTFFLTSDILDIW